MVRQEHGRAGFIALLTAASDASSAGEAAAGEPPEQRRNVGKAWREQASPGSRQPADRSLSPRA